MLQISFFVMLVHSDIVYLEIRENIFLKYKRRITKGLLKMSKYKAIFHYLKTFLRLKN